MLGSSWLGPVYDLDRRLVARARWLYIARVGFLLVLLVGLTLAEMERSESNGLGLIQQQAATGASFFNYIISIALTMAFLIGPTAITGSICQERARGAFDLFLATGLTSTEIVWGKLCARLWPILGTMAVALPVVALASLMGGVDPEMLFGSFLVCCALALFTSTLAMAFALRTVKPHEALLATYFVLFFVMGFVPFLLAILLVFDQNARIVPFGWLLRLNPIRAAFSAGEQEPVFLIAQESHWVDHLIVVAWLVGMSLLLTLWSTFRLRRIVTTTRRRKAKPERPIPAGKAARDAQLLDVDPVYFRECRRRRASGAMRWVWGGLIGVSVLLGAVALLACLRDDTEEIFVMVCELLTLLGFLMLAAVVPTSLSEERAQGALDVLVITPLTAREIIRGKWRANFRLVLRLGLVPILVSLIAALLLRTDPDKIGTVAVLSAPNGTTRQIMMTSPVPSAALAFSGGTAIAPKALANYATGFDLLAVSSSPSELIATSSRLAIRAFRQHEAAVAAFELIEFMGTATANSIVMVGAGGVEGILQEQMPGFVSPLQPISTAAPMPMTFPPGTKTSVQIFGPPPPLARLGVSLVFLIWFLCWGALLVSLGLAVATVFHRPGWATTANIILVVTIALGIPTLSWATTSDADESPGKAMYLTPLTAPVVINLAIQQHGKVEQPTYREAMLYGSFSAAIAGISAWLVYRWSVKRFDQSLGRAANARSGRRTPPSKGKLAEVALAST